ncbi:MAG: hypothetical protein M5U20_08400 [Phycisphaerales bacterium]|nr:hypothetical protein [Phycisphaerales bacterium]
MSRPTAGSCPGRPNLLGQGVLVERTPERVVHQPTRVLRVARGRREGPLDGGPHGRPFGGSQAGPAGQQQIVVRQ